MREKWFVKNTNEASTPTMPEIELAGLSPPISCPPPCMMSESSPCMMAGTPTGMGIPPPSPSPPAPPQAMSGTPPDMAKPWATSSDKHIEHPVTPPPPFPNRGPPTTGGMSELSGGLTEQPMNSQHRPKDHPAEAPPSDKQLYNSTNPSFNVQGSRIVQGIAGLHSFKIHGMLPWQLRCIRSKEGIINRPVALFEPPDPSKNPLYCKDKVYQGSTEFSFEELQAERWKAREMETTLQGSKRIRTTPEIEPCASELSSGKELVLEPLVQCNQPMYCKDQGATEVCFEEAAQQEVRQMEIQSHVVMMASSAGSSTTVSIPPPIAKSLNRLGHKPKKAIKEVSNYNEVNIKPMPHIGSVPPGNKNFTELLGSIEDRLKDVAREDLKGKLEEQMMEALETWWDSQKSEHEKKGDTSVRSKKGDAEDASPPTKKMKLEEDEDRASPDSGVGSRAISPTDSNNQSRAATPAERLDDSGVASPEKEDEEVDEDVEEAVEKEKAKFEEELSDSELSSGSSEEESEDDWDDDDDNAFAKKKKTAVTRKPAAKGNGKLLAPIVIPGAMKSELALSDYEKIRNDNIKEREDMLAALMADFAKYKEDNGMAATPQQNKGKKIDKDGSKEARKKKMEESKRKKKEKTEFNWPRRSTRDKKSVNYDDNLSDSFGNVGLKKRKKLTKIKIDQSTEVTNKEDNKISSSESAVPGTHKEDNKIDSSESAVPLSRLRTRRIIDYGEETPQDDDYIFCDDCHEPKLHGCKEHPPIFDYVGNFEIGPSRAGPNSGRGVFNMDKNGIPKGVMLGPYKGKHYTPKGYNIMKKRDGESGYAWELHDTNGQVSGFVDPGPNPNPKKNVMAMVNCAAKEVCQNTVACQYKGEIYYRAVRLIKYGEEVLTDYGDDYAQDIGIDLTKRNLYDGPENWKEKGAKCPHCEVVFSSNDFLEAHINGDLYHCKGLAEELNKEKKKEADEMPFVCEICGKGFKFLSRLKAHLPVHNKIKLKLFACSECDKSFERKEALTKHVKIKHLGAELGKCPKCEATFTTSSSRHIHIKTNCYQDKAFKCEQCGFLCSTKGRLDEHVKNRHEPSQFLHKCTLCDKRFGRKTNLESHMNEYHQNLRPFVCETCNRDFKSKRYLADHKIRAHTKEWKMFCFVCALKGEETGFTKSSQLEKHLKSKHPVEYKEDLERTNPASCTQCPKRFPSEECVQIHMSKFHGKD